MKVIVDNRETQKRKDRAKKIFDKIEIKKLDSGDYVYKDIAIELKTTDDFISSVRDKRVFNQSKRMINTYKDSYVIIYGNMTKSIKKTKYFNRYFSVKNYLGALASLSQIIKVLKVENESQAFTLMKKIFEKGTDGKNRNVIKIKQNENKILGFIMYLGNINSKKATMIIKQNKIKTLEDLININEKDLTKIKGIGKKTANKIITNLR